MTDKYRDLGSELSKVEAAIRDAPLYADPSNPRAGFSDRLVDLVAREDCVLGQIIDQARRDLTAP